MYILYVRWVLRFGLPSSKIEKIFIFLSTYVDIPWGLNMVPVRLEVPVLSVHLQRISAESYPERLWRGSGGIKRYNDERVKRSPPPTL